MRKTKSMEDIANQAHRLFMQAGDYDRQKRISQIRNRYMNNIKGLKSKSDLWQKRADYYTNQDRWLRTVSEDYQRQYTRRQYMGLNNG